MQRIFKVTSILLYISVLLVSCRGVTPVPTSLPTITKTPRPSATLKSTQTPTSSPTPIPTITPTSGLPAFQASNSPSLDVSQYRLRPWQEQDYGYLQNNMDEYQEAFEIPYFTLGDYMAVFQSERLLRFADSPEVENRLWELLQTKPDIKNVPGVRPGEDLMGLLITNLLEHGTSLTDLKTEIAKHGMFQIDVLDVPKLGTGENGLVVQITMNGLVDRLMAVYAVTLNDGKYQVDVITPWEITNRPGWGLYTELHGVGDTNKNGLSEFVIQEQTGASGMPQVWSETVLHVEWSEDEEDFSVSTIPVFHQECDEFGGGPCEGDWEFSSINSKNTLITRSYWSTRGKCPELIIQRDSIWDGKQYPPGNPRVVLPQDDLSPECRLAWAETASSLEEFTFKEDGIAAGWKNDQIISTVEQSVKNWTPQMDDIWGPAGADYFKLRLAIWHDVRGEDEKAAEILEDLTRNPNGKYDFISRLANTYLQVRGQRGNTQACLALKETYYEAFSDIASESSMYNNDKLFLEYWGVVDWKGSLCDTDAMLSSDAGKLKGTSPKDIRNFLKKSGARIYYDTHSDLNNDNTKDYLALVEFDDSDNIDAWAFLKADGGLKAKLIYSFYSEDNQPKSKFRSIQTEDGLIHLIAVDDEYIFTTFSAGPSPKVIFEEYGVRDFKLVEDVLPLRVVVDVDNFIDGKETRSYQWDSSAKEFVPLQSPFVSAQTNVEEMFYERHNYSGAIEYIDEFLSNAPPETPSWYECGVDIPEGCNYLPEWYAPYFRYMRGLAYEQLGNEEQAKQTYYQLWRDFPNHVFGVAAGLKLEPIKP